MGYPISSCRSQVEKGSHLDLDKRIKLRKSSSVGRKIMMARATEVSRSGRLLCRSFLSCCLPQR